MQTITTIGLDIAKSVFQIHAVDAGGQPHSYATPTLF
jgi:transposase